MKIMLNTINGLKRLQFFPWWFLHSRFKPYFFLSISLTWKVPQLSN